MNKIIHSQVPKDNNNTKKKEVKDIPSDVNIDVDMDTDTDTDINIDIDIDIDININININIDIDINNDDDMVSSDVHLPAINSFKDVKQQW